MKRHGIATAFRSCFVILFLAFCLHPLSFALGKKLQLDIELNNPFSPSAGQTTRFKYSAPEKDRRVKICIFTVSGQLVRDFGEQQLTADVPATLVWNGTNADGEIVARGLYLVNLQDLDDGNGVTRKVLVVAR